MIETTTPWIWLYAMLGLVIGYWAVTKIMDQSWQRGYWKGRGVGWEMHRRYIQLNHLEGKIKISTVKKTDEVFDYDNHN